MRVLRPEAPRSHAHACHRITTVNRTQRGCFDFPASIRPQGHIFGEQIRQGGHFSALHCCQEAGEQLPVRFWSWWEAWPPVDQVLLRPAEGAATGGFTLLEHGSNLGKLVLEDFAQEEDRSLERLELLQQDQKGQRDRLLCLDTLFGIGCCGSLFCEDRLR